MSEWIDLQALGQIAGLGLICGAGLPALFALGLRALSLPGPGTGGRGDAASDRVIGGSRAGLAAAALCFAIVVGAIAWGIYLVVAGSSK